MCDEGTLLDYITCDRAATDPAVLPMLLALPRVQWTMRNKNGLTFLHYACCGKHVGAVVTLIQSKLLDVNARDRWKSTAAYYAVLYKQHAALEVLCAAGVDLLARDEHWSPLDAALVGRALISRDVCARVLLANGVRLSTVHKDYRHHIPPHLEAFERGVLRCRAAVVAMLTLRKRGVPLLLTIGCKYMAVELAVALHATRYDSAWQK